MGAFGVDTGPSPGAECVSKRALLRRETGQDLAEGQGDLRSGTKDASKQLRERAVLEAGGFQTQPM